MSHENSAIPGDHLASPEDGGSDDAVFISSGEDDADAADEKKKLGLKTSYDGFQIYGRILCLVVKRKDQGKTSGGVNTTRKDRGKTATTVDQANESVAKMVQRTATSQATAETEGIMEGWMRSTQVGNESRGIAGAGNDALIDGDDGDD